MASTFGHMDMVRWLVERGADVRCKDTYGFTPMHRAAKVQLPVCHPNAEGATAFLLSQRRERDARWSRATVCSFLIERECIFF